MVVDREFLGSDVALMVPKTSDGRVLFAVPWLGKVVLGTTDTPSKDLAVEPTPYQEETDFILREAGRYLRKAPTPRDIKSIWVGLRPLVKQQDDNAQATKKISREHTVEISRSGLVTVTGGKWTTYRVMAEDVLDACVESSLLRAGMLSETHKLALVGSPGAGQGQVSLSLAPGLHSYGSEQAAVAALPGGERWMIEGLTEAMVRFAARYEYALTVEDVLARRSRLLFLDAKAAAAVAADVGEILAEELGTDPETEKFCTLAQHYWKIS